MSEMNEVTYRMVDAGSRMASDLITAQVSRNMGGVGGAPAWREWGAAKAPNRDLAVQYAEGQIQAGRNPILDVPEEGPDRGEPAIAGPHTAAAPGLDMVQESHDHVGAEILDLKIGRPTLQPIGSELNEEDEAVGIGLHRVRADSTFAWQMLTQVCREMRSERRHAASPR